MVASSVFLLICELVLMQVYYFLWNLRWNGNNLDKKENQRSFSKWESKLKSWELQNNVKPPGITMSIKRKQGQATGRVWGRQESGRGPLTTCPVAPWALSAPGASGGILGHPQARSWVSWATGVQKDLGQAFWTWISFWFISFNKLIYVHTMQRALLVWGITTEDNYISLGR